MRFPGSGEGGGGAGSAGSAGPALTETWASESSPFSADGCSLPCFELRPGQAPWGGGGRGISGYSEHWPRRPSGARLKRTPPRLWPPSGGSPLAPRTTKNKLVPDVLRKAYRTEPEVKPSILFALKYP